MTVNVELTQPGWVNDLRDKLIRLAWRRYRVGHQDAADIFQTAVATWIEVQDRYAGEQNQVGILRGIFVNKCLEHIDRSVREKRKLREAAEQVEGQKTIVKHEGTGEEEVLNPLSELIRREDGQLILDSVEDLRPEAREMFRLLAEEEYGRKGLIQYYGINKNTLDTRLRIFRNELRALLRRRGIRI